VEIDKHFRILPGRRGFLKFGGSWFFTGLIAVGRGLPGGKLLSFVSPKESNQRKGDPDIPEFPKTEPAGRAAKNSPHLAVFNWFFVGGAQTPSPLIRPAGSVFDGPVRGRKSKPGQ
jgi:hypothetical protein